MKNLLRKIQTERRRKAFLNRKLAALTDDTLLDRMSGKQAAQAKKRGLVYKVLVAISWPELRSRKA